MFEVLELLLMGRPAGPLHEDEMKRSHNITVTDTAWKGLRAIASANGLTISSLLEEIGRGRIFLVEEGDQKKSNKSD